MEGLVFMAGTFFIEGGLVLILLWVLTGGERGAREREEAARRELSRLAEEEERMRAAA